jgi:hypothetical protein
MKYFYLTFLSIVFSAGLFAQQLSPTVISAGGGSYQSSQFAIDYTIGETFITTLTGNGYMVTQGFHQPILPVIEGCTSENACNYNALATFEDGSCVFIGDPCDDAIAETVNDVIGADCFCEGEFVEILGCTEVSACNYDASANTDNGSCYFSGDNCDDGDVTTVNDVYNAECVCEGEVIVVIEGCMAMEACNYDALATVENGSCVFVGDVCDDELAETIDDVIGADCFCSGVIVDFLGCTEITACNYDSGANVEDGSCYFPGDNCDDGDVTTVNDVYNADCVCEGEVIVVIEGCTAIDACNFDALATFDNGSCVFVGDACDDELSETVNDVIGTDCFCSGVVIEFFGCTNISACNYDSGANVEDGSCYFSGDSCDDGDATTVNDVYNDFCLCEGEVILVIEGCTAIDACNYDALATVNNGSCVFIGDVCDDELAETTNDVIGADCFCAGEIIEVPGCIDLTACNYDAGANADDGSCYFPGDNCNDGDATTVNDVYNVDCVCEGEVILVIEGCMAMEACNYDALATMDNGSCVFIGDACDDELSETFNDVIGTDCFCAGEIIEILGCINESACNYNAAANTDDGSCYFPGDNCDDGDATTENDVYNADCVCEGDVILVIEGCMAMEACNYDALATMDNGSCVFIGDACDDELSETFNDVIGTDCFCAGEIIETLGCINESACNFDAAANTDDGSCYFPGDNCDDGDATTVNDVYTVDCVCEGEVILVIEGCTAIDACNYDALATVNDGSCVFIGDACDDELSETFNDVIGTDCFCAGEIIEILGCINESACNFDAAANTDDGSCYFPGDNCNDGDDTTVNDVYNVDCVCEGEAVVEIFGCTDTTACNYNPNATTSDNSCTYPAADCVDCDGNCIIDSDGDGTCDCLEIEGCTNPESVNYNPDATEFDGSCVLGCTDPTAINYNTNANEDDGSCLYPLAGCTYPSACNFNPLATSDDGSCTFPGCNDASACNFDAEAGCLLEGSCEFLDENNNGLCDSLEVLGCTDPLACNYNSSANVNDGSCGYESTQIIEVTSDSTNFVWEDVTYTESGLYQFVYTNAAGCDSIVVLDLTLTLMNVSSENNLQMWPNPANQEVQITWNGLAADMIDVFDIAGKRVATFNRQTRFDVSNWAPGSYMIRLRKGNQWMDRRLMVVR